VQLGGDVILQHFMYKKPRQLALDINHIDIKCYSDYQKGHKQVQHNLQKGRFNINLGGDHSIAAATIQPLLTHYKDDVLVIWIDAHADLNTQRSSLTKNIHGMPAGALTGLMDHWYMYDKSMRSKSMRSTLAMQNLLYIGIRDLDPFEQDTIMTYGIPHFPTYTSAVSQTIRAHPAQHIHISCDIDSMDPCIMPSTGTPVPHGLALKNVLNIIKAAKPRLIGFDLVEFNPLLGNKRQVRTTLNNIHRILNKVIEK
jgi:arginase